jgi:hypothetical protein
VSQKLQKATGVVEFVSKGNEANTRGCGFDLVKIALFAFVPRGFGLGIGIGAAFDDGTNFVAKLRSNLLSGRNTALIFDRVMETLNRWAM